MRLSNKLIFILCSFILVSCSIFQGASDTVIDMLPRESDVPGWKKSGNDEYFKGKDVKKYNREYRWMGIERLASSLYESIDDSDIKIRLEVIKFNSVLDAYGFYSTRRGPGIFEVSETNEYYSNIIALVQTGNYVIFASTDKSELLLKKELKTFANIPFMYIGKAYSKEKLPESLSVLKGIDGYGVLYSRRPYHQFPFIREIYFTQWSWNDDFIELFYSEKDSFYDAYELFKKTTGNDYILISSDDKYTAFRKEQDGKYSFISVNGKWIFGCWSVGDFNEGKNVLGEIIARLEAYKKKSKN